MSTTQHEAEPDNSAGVTGASAVPAQRAAAEQATAPQAPRGGVVVAVAAAAVLAVVAGGVVTWKLTHSGASATDAVTLPTTLMGLSPAGNDPYTSDRFLTRVTEAIGTTPYAARMYGDQTKGRSIRVVAARTDLTKKLDEAWAVDAGTQTDGVTCTQNVQLVPNGRAAVRPTVMLCWKNTPDLSVYTIIIDPKATQVDQGDGVASVNEIWDTVS